MLIRMCFFFIVTTIAGIDFGAAAEAEPAEAFAVVAATAVTREWFAGTDTKIFSYLFRFSNWGEFGCWSLISIFVQ